MLKDVKIGRRLGFAFGVVLLLTGAVSAAAWWGLTVLGVGAWWMWRGKRPRERGSDEPPRAG